MIKFKDELRNYRPPRSSAIKEHLRRWLEHDSSDAVWAKVNSAAGANLTSVEFIKRVIRARADAAGFPARIKGAVAERDLVVNWHAPRITEALAKGKSLSEIAEVLDDAAFEMRLIEKYSVLDLANYPVGTPSRKNQKGSQSRRAFCLIMSEFFKERCGKWMDSEVAVLLDIALPRDEATDIQEVRDYRTSAKNQKAGGGFEPQKLH